MIIIMNMLAKTAQRLKELETYEIVLKDGEFKYLNDVYIPYNEPIVMVFDSREKETVFIKTDVTGEHKIHISADEYECIEIK